MITFLATVSHYLSNSSQGVVKDQQKPALCSFLFHTTTPCHTLTTSSLFPTISSVGK
ncbi:unnamed protein product [Schistosoma mattheei]|uniref:Uncharacterized protein n=1 Tax=Schistosoma mattheei TaxID=31246 RepID=A0A3P8GUA9_9TREM|nr:unnamed protein product [Schistosoma mattheei]